MTASWLTVDTLSERSVWPSLNEISHGVDRIVIHECGQFVIYELDKTMSGHCIYDRVKVLSYKKRGWFRREITDREALEAAIIYAKESDAATSPYRAMAAEIIEIQSVVDNLL